MTRKVRIAVIIFFILFLTANSKICVAILTDEEDENPEEPEVGEEAAQFNAENHINYFLKTFNHCNVDLKNGQCAKQPIKQLLMCELAN